MELGRKVLNLRLDQGLSQKYLAEQCGITPGALSKIETGTNKPSAEVLVNIARILSTSTEYLVDDQAPYPVPEPLSLNMTSGQKINTKINCSIDHREDRLLKDLKTLGAYWREAAFAIPAASMETIRIVRFLLQRDLSDDAGMSGSLEDLPVEAGVSPFFSGMKGVRSAEVKARD